MKNLEIRGLSGPQEINLRDLWKIALRRKWIIINVTVAGLALATLISFLTAPTYTATGQLLIDREPNILSFEEVLQIESLNNDYYQTQFKLLQSRALASQTIDRMRLYDNAAFVKRVLGGGKLTSVDPKNDPQVRGRLISALLGRLSIRPVRQTRLVQASFSDHDPRFAASVLNALFDTYIEMNIQKRFQATEQATDFLTKQIASVQGEIEEGEKKLQEYGNEKNIVALSSSENTVIEKLGELNKAMTEAQIDRVNKETYYNEIVVATPDYIPDALANPLIQKLREEYTGLNRDYAKKSETYLPNHPEMQSLKAAMDSSKKALEDETQALIKRAYSDFQGALKKEQALAAVFNQQKREAFQLNSNAIQYNSLQIQIQNQKSLLESLMKRKSETDVSSRLKGLRTSNIWIVDRAEIPPGPSSPNKRRNVMFGLMIGLLGGVGLAFLFERLDNTVKNAEDVEAYSGLPLLGIVPEYVTAESRKGGPNRSGLESLSAEQKAKPGEMPLDDRPLGSVVERQGGPGGERRDSMELIVHFLPTCAFSEHYRSIRTTFLLSVAGDKTQTVAVTSALPREGKSATITNLAVAMSQAGKSVVVIDADLRRPRLHKIFRVKNLNGLTNYLTSDLLLEDLLRSTPIPKLFLINAGPVPPNPVELLASEKMARLLDRLKSLVDFILVDTPPILAVSDAVVLGRQVDGTILVVKGGKTPREALKQSRERLDTHKIRGMGVIINQVRMRDHDHYYSDSYYQYYGTPQS